MSQYLQTDVSAGPVVKNLPANAGDLSAYKTDKLIVSNGTVTVSNGAVALGAYSSAVFLQ